MTSYYLAQLSDCHVDTASAICVDTGKKTQNLLERLKQYNVDKLIITGDLVHNPDDKNYQYLAEILAKSEFDISVIAGNHDDEKQMDRYLKPWLNPVLSLGVWRVVFINSVVVNQVFGRLESAELERLECLLNQYKDQPILLALHHPIVPMESSWDDDLSLQNPQDLFAITDKFSNLKIISWGHSHQYKTVYRNGVLLLSCPSAVKQFSPEVSEDSACILFKLSDNGCFSHKKIVL